MIKSPKAFSADSPSTMTWDIKHSSIGHSLVRQINYIIRRQIRYLQYIDKSDQSELVCLPVSAKIARLTVWRGVSSEIRLRSPCTMVAFQLKTAMDNFTLIVSHSCVAADSNPDGLLITALVYNDSNKAAKKVVAWLCDLIRVTHDWYSWLSASSASLLNLYEIIISCLQWKFDPAELKCSEGGSLIMWSTFPSISIAFLPTCHTLHWRPLMKPAKSLINTNTNLPTG